MSGEDIEVFQPLNIVQWRNVPFNIQSIELTGTTLMAGTNLGQLLTYELPEGSVGQVPRILATKKDFLKTSSPSPITQLQAVPEFDLLLCVADAQVHIHHLKTLAHINTVDKSKGTIFFAADFRVRGIPQADTHRRSEARPKLPRDRLTLQLCCILKRRLHIFDVDEHGNTKAVKEMPAPDTPQTAVWCGRRLLVGFKREYDHIEVDSGRVMEVPTGSSGSFERLAVRLPDNTFAITAEREGRPVVLFKDIEGKPLKKYAIQFDNWPKAIDTFGPFIFALTSKGVEVRFNDETSKKVQFVRLDGLAYTVQGHTLLVGAPHCLWQMQTVSPETQIERLVEVNRFVDAKKIEAAMPGTPEEHLKRRYRLDKEHAYYEFNRKKHFSVALDLLKGIEVSPTTVLRLYPWLLPKQAAAEAVAGTAPLTDEQKREATKALILYLTEKRTQLYQFESKAETAAEAEKRRNLMSIVDTTLLICYVETDSPLLRSFVRVNNHCEISESEKVLKAKNKTEELVLLYQNRGYHRKALDLLRAHIERRPDPKAMSDAEYRDLTQRQAKWRQAMISHLQSLKAEHVDLLVEYSTPILEHDEEQGLSIFISDDFPNVKTFPRVPIMAHLRKKFPHLLIRYLEHVVFKWHDTSREIHTALALAYLHELETQQPLPPLSDPKRQRLYRFLRSSSYLDASEVMRRVASASKGFVEERALLLGQLGRHTEALRILAGEVDDPALAEQYCADNYDEHDINKKDLFMVLVEHYLRPPKGPPKTEHALAVIRQHSDKVNPLKTMDMLPPDTKISDIHNFLTAIMMEREHTRRAVAVQANLAKTEQLQVSERRIAIHSKHFKVTEDTLCSVCRKPIRTHAFAIYPCGTLVHLHCMEDETQCPRHNAQGRCRLTLS